MCRLQTHPSVAERKLPGYLPLTEAKGEKVRGTAAQRHWGVTQTHLVDSAEHLVSGYI